MEVISATAQACTLELALACNFREVPLASEALHEFLLRHGWKEIEVIDCELALVEACNNAVKYAEGDARLQPVRVEVQVSPEDIEIRVFDYTPGFELPDKIELPDPHSESGRGLFLIKAVMETVQYLRGPSGNALIMKRHKAGPGGYST